MHRLGDLGIDFGQFLTGLADMLRAQLAVALGSGSVEVSERARAALHERRERISAADLLRMLTALGELEQRFRKSGQQQLLLETLLVRFALIDRTVAIEDVLRSLGDGGPSASGSRSSAVFAAPPGRVGDAGRSALGEPPPRRPAPEALPSGERSAPPSGDRPVSPPIVRDQSGGPRAAASPESSATATLAPPRPRVVGVATSAVPPINVIAERWDEVVVALRANRMLLAPFLEQAVPSAISSTGVLTVRADDTASAEALDAGIADMLAVVHSIFPAIERVVIARPEGSPSSAPPRRVTEEEIRAQRIASLRKRDPVLGAAIDVLDLELLD